MGVSELKFLGHVISANGVRPDPEKVKAILEAPLPEDQAQLRSFLGSITCLTQYVPHLATVIALTGSSHKRAYRGGGQQQRNQPTKELRN